MAQMLNGSGGLTTKTYAKKTSSGNTKKVTVATNYNKLMKSNGYKDTTAYKRADGTVQSEAGRAGIVTDPTPTTSNTSSSSNSSSSYAAQQAAAAAQAAAEAQAQKEKEEREAAERAAAQAAALKAAQQARLDAVNAANSALDQQGKSLEEKYNNQLSSSANDYQTLRNQNDVNYMKALYNQREALANRGALNSGTGRYENLVTGNSYNKTLDSINSQEQSERQNIQNNISSMWANIAQQKASNNNTTLENYTNALQNIINSTYSGYSPENSDYYNNALNTLNSAFSTGSTNTANSTTKNGVSAYARLLASLGYDI